MLFEHLVVEDFKASDVPVKTPPTREEYIPKDLHKLLIDRAVAVGNKMKTSGMERIREHNSYSGLQSEKYLTVLARNFLNDLNMDLFEIMFVYLTRTTIGKSFFEHCYLVMKGSDQTLFEGNEVADFVRAWREAILPVNGFTRLKEKINAKSTISQKLPSPYKFNQYHAAIVPFIKYSLKINPITATNITAISPCLAMKLLHLCDQSSVNQFNNNYYKLWWDDRRVEGSKGIITLSRNGSLLKRDILVLLLSPIKLKDLFKSNDDKDKEVLTNIIPEIQQIMTNNPANYCSSDLLAMKEILDPSFKQENQSSNILSTLAIMNNIIYSNSLDTKSKTKYIINLIPPKMRKQLIEALSSENLMHIDYENILTQDERTLCESNNIGMKYAYLLGNDRTYYDQLPICWRCNCTKKMNKTSLIDLFAFTPFFPNVNIESFNLFKLRFFQHVFDLLHCDERTLEHMLNNTCLNDERLMEFLVELLPKLVKTHCNQTIHLKLSNSQDKNNNNTGDSTKNKKSFSFIDASYVRPITNVYPYFLPALKEKFDEILFEKRSNTVNRTDIIGFVDQTYSNICHNPSNISNDEPLINSFFEMQVDNSTQNNILPETSNLMEDDECDCDEFLDEDFLEEDNDETEDGLFDINGKNINDREIIELIHERFGIGNEFNPFSEDGNISKLWSEFSEVQEYLHYNDEQVIQVINDPKKAFKVKNGVSGFCSLYVEVFEKSPHYLHQMKYHLFEVWLQIYSLKNAMNFVNEGLGSYHVTDNKIRGRNGGLGSDSRTDLIFQHIVEGFLFKDKNLWTKLQQVMEDRYKFQQSKDIFDKMLNQSEGLLAHDP